MRILVDENIDEAFPEFMPKHDVSHVVEMGWQGTKPNLKWSLRPTRTCPVCLVEGP
jgi:hypothetical protein